MTRLNSILRLLLASALLAATAPAMAQEKIVLKVADRYAAGHFIPEYATKFWMDGVTKATGGQVTFQYFPGQQLGKPQDMLSLTASGVADVGEVIPSMVAEKLPLSTVAELPGLFSTSCEGGLAAFSLMRPGGFVDQQEFQAAGVRMLFMLVLPPYQLYTKSEISGLQSLRGLKIRSAGPGMDLTIRNLGAVPIRIGATEVHEALSRGTIDGSIYPAASVLQYDLTPFLKGGTVDHNFGSVVISYAISERRWKQLPPNVQKAMTEVGEEATRRTCKLLDGDDVAASEKIRSKGVALTKFSDAEREQTKAAMAPVAQEWAVSMDKRGKAGSEGLKAFRAAIAGSK
jgi:TRAP-type C4-dicarboxylate transport system substrate-binding protein